jgi:hypothetical protein
MSIFPTSKAMWTLRREAHRWSEDAEYDKQARIQFLKELGVPAIEEASQENLRNEETPRPDLSIVHAKARLVRECFLAERIPGIVSVRDW